MIKNKDQRPADLRAQKLLLFLFLLSIFSISIFLFYGMTPDNFDFNFPRRLKKIIAMALVSICIGYSSVVFQTITESRILTPSVMGLDSLYLFIQSLIVFIFGARQLVVMDSTLHFLLSVGIMMSTSWGIYQLVFHNESRNIYTLVLTGMITGTFFRGISSFIQLLIDPNEFAILQDKMFASFKNINEDLLLASCLILLVSMILSRKDISKFDVLGLGKDSSISLGIAYNKLVRKTLLIISVMVSISTVLVGPVTFLGILLVSLSRELMKTFRHKYLIAGAILIGLAALPLGQFMTERIFSGGTTLSVILNFIGGIYFIFILLKESRR